VAIDQSMLETITAQMMDELEAVYGDDAEITTAGLLVAVNYGDGKGAVHFRYSPGTHEHVALGLLVQAQN
jgi:hypothetical protein